MKYRRLKSSEVKDYRLEQLKQQDYKCALSQQPLTAERAVLDHCHKTGQVRAVLDRGVNSLLGKIENGMIMNRVTREVLAEIARNLIDYLENSPKELYHPTYRTPEEKRQKIKKRALAKRKRTK